MFPPTTKILITDDMAMFRQMVKQGLSELGLKNFIETCNGEEAWKTFEQAHNEGKGFQLVISDWSMPKMTGIELLTKVRGSNWGKTIPFIMLTGEAEKKNIMQAIEAGVSQYMIKPFTVNALRDKLKLTFEKSQKMAGSQIIIEE